MFWKRLRGQEKFFEVSFPVFIFLLQRVSAFFFNIKIFNILPLRHSLRLTPLIVLWPL